MKAGSADLLLRHGPEGNFLSYVEADAESIGRPVPELTGLIR